MCRRPASPGYMMAFFLTQPLILLAEDAVRALPPLQRLLRRPGGPPLWFQACEVAATLATVVTTAHLLFWQPFETCELDTKGLLEIKEITGALRVAPPWGRQLG